MTGKPSAAKTPTASSISALLGRQPGFRRAASKNSGFMVRKDYETEGQVVVTHRFWSWVRPAERYAEKLAEYAKVIEGAGYKVFTDGTGQGCLVVSRRAEETT